MNITHSQKGFTLLESLVAISILLIAVVGPMSIIGRSLPQSAYARDHAIAVNLAQEGIEAVRQKRDSNMLSKWSTGSPVWDNGIDANNYYAVDSMAPSLLIPCGLAVCNGTILPVRQDAATGLYYQSSAGGGTVTKFERYIFIMSTTPEEKEVLSYVSWRDSMNVLRELMIVEYIAGINS